MHATSHQMHPSIFLGAGSSFRWPGFKISLHALSMQVWSPNSQFNQSGQKGDPCIFCWFQIGGCFKGNPKENPPILEVQFPKRYTPQKRSPRAEPHPRESLLGRFGILPHGRPLRLRRLGRRIPPLRRHVPAHRLPTKRKRARGPGATWRRLECLGLLKV